MKIITSSLKNGKINSEDIPFPILKKNHFLIQSSTSLISSGTERMIIDFGKSSIFGKVSAQPDKVNQVLSKIKTDGVFSTLDAVLSKLDIPIPLGYCNVGSIVDGESDANKFFIGDRVVSNGYHAEAVSVPHNLMAKIPDNVTDEEATFTILGSIALQGIRLASPTIGEKFVVYGLGLIGLLTVQILKSNGCEVLGLDYNLQRLELAQKFGAKIFNLNDNPDPSLAVNNFTECIGADAVVICTSTNSNDPIYYSPKICRKGGRVILTGTSGLNISRDEFFKKEITFQVSSSYGPGRYDPNYEDKGIDYPIGYVRWTQQRNFEAILKLLSDKKLDVLSLISHRFQFENFINAYKTVDEKNALGLILNYTKNVSLFDRTIEINSSEKFNLKSEVISLIGSGNYSSRILIPCLKKTKKSLHTLVSENGISSSFFGKKFGFKYASTDVEDILKNREITDIFIATRHDTHSDLVIRSLQAGKNVFVEKPMCINKNELIEIKDIYSRLKTKTKLFVGFNRRYAPIIIFVKDKIQNLNSPLSINITVNAGVIEKSHWTQDRSIGGGRILGEACHFIDLILYLTSSKIKSACVNHMDSLCRDTCTITLKFEDGSIGTINYFANGNKHFPKEKIEIFCNENIFYINNFKNLEIFNNKGRKNFKYLRQNKGQLNCLKYYFNDFNSNNKYFEDLCSVHEVLFQLINENS